MLCFCRCGRATWPTMDDPPTRRRKAVPKRCFLCSPFTCRVLKARDALPDTSLHPSTLFQPSMHFLCLLVILASTTGAFCHNCLSDNEASFLINGYTTLITNTQTNFNLTLANEILASDYQSTSAGVDYVREEPVCRLYLSTTTQINLPTEPDTYLLNRTPNLLI